MFRGKSLPLTLQRSAGQETLANKLANISFSLPVVFDIILICQNIITYDCTFRGQPVTKMVINPSKLTNSWIKIWTRFAHNSVTKINHGYVTNFQNKGCRVAKLIVYKLRTINFFHNASMFLRFSGVQRSIINTKNGENL